ncbi:MAG: recombination-associated protein RdgC [Rubrivivax sp.]|nr:MAG: recombination-associated protein RdgC [Rubrivivax sp.]
MFKNLTVYRIGPDWSASVAEMEERLHKARFVPCGLTQQQSSGWVEPRGIKHAPLVEKIGGQLLLKLMIEQRVLPGAVVKRRVDEITAKIEQDTGRKPGKKQTKEIKEQAMLELLPMAFTKQASVHVWIDPDQRFLLVDSSSQGKADEVVGFLVKTLESIAVSQLHTQQSAAVGMAEWLVSGEPPASFTVDRDCELKSADEMKSVVRYARHLLDIDEVRQHITSGKVPTKLGMSWEGRVSFMLTDTMQIKKLTFLDVVFEGQKATSKDEAFDADAAIATGELSQLLPDLIDALGGEHAIGGV